MTAANEDQFADSDCVREATGYQWRDARHGGRRTLKTEPLQDAPGGFAYERNGGLIIRRRVEVQEDVLLVRFAGRLDRNGRPQSAENLINSPWWLTEDRLAWLISRAREAGVALGEMARRQLAIPTDWSSCDLLVRARVRSGFVLAAYAGPGYTASVRKDGRVVERRIIAHEVPTLWMEQLYIPGLGRQPWNYVPPPNAAALWLTFRGTLPPPRTGA